eukprot:3295124-Prymnesium_polylepis.1
MHAAAPQLSKDWKMYWHWSALWSPLGHRGVAAAGIGTLGPPARPDPCAGVRFVVDRAEPMIRVVGGAPGLRRQQACSFEIQDQVFGAEQTSNQRRTQSLCAFQRNLRASTARVLRAIALVCAQNRS